MVNIHFDESEMPLASVLICQLGECGCNRAARAAPVRIEVHDNVRVWCEDGVHLVVGGDLNDLERGFGNRGAICEDMLP